MHHDFFRCVFGGVFVSLFLLFLPFDFGTWDTRSGRGKLPDSELFCARFGVVRGPFCAVKYNIACAWPEFAVRSFLRCLFGDPAVQNEAC